MSSPTAAAATKTASRPRGKKPKRPMTAYNFFYRYERERIVVSQTSGEGSGACTAHDKSKRRRLSVTSSDDSGIGQTSSSSSRNTSPCSFSLKPASTALVEHRTSFAEMGKEISKRWRDIGVDGLDKYQKMAEGDVDRYKRELQAYERELLELEAEGRANKGAPKQHQMQRDHLATAASTSKNSGGPKNEEDQQPMNSHQPEYPFQGQAQVQVGSGDMVQMQLIHQLLNDQHGLLNQAQAQVQVQVQQQIPQPQTQHSSILHVPPALPLHSLVSTLSSSNSDFGSSICSAIPGSAQQHPSYLPQLQQQLISQLPQNLQVQVLMGLLQQQQQQQQQHVGGGRPTALAFSPPPMISTTSTGQINQLLVQQNQQLQEEVYKLKNEQQQEKQHHNTVSQSVSMPGSSDTVSLASSKKALPIKKMKATPEHGKKRKRTGKIDDGTSVSVDEASEGLLALCSGGTTEGSLLSSLSRSKGGTLKANIQIDYSKMSSMSGSDSDNVSSHEASDHGKQGQESS